MNNGNSKMVSSSFASFDEANILTLTSEKDNKSTKRLYTTKNFEPVVFTSRTTPDGFFTMLATILLNV